MKKLFAGINKLALILIGVTALALAAAVFFYAENMKLKENPQIASQKETQELVAKVSKLAVLPAGETPTVATVSDPAALKDQAFFAQAQKGDKVLIYTNSKKAILYSVTLNRILDVAPLNIGSTRAASTEE